MSGYSVSVFAKGSGARSNPDSIVVDGQNVYVGYQNVTAKERRRSQSEHRRAVRLGG